MKHSQKSLLLMVGGLAFCTTAQAVPAVNSEGSGGNPYQSIVDRNVFSLKPPPPPAEPVEVNKPQALKITLTGITTIFGDKRVLMKTAPPPGKPGEPPKTEQSYILTEGQREGEIEVISIDEKTGTVKVNNAGSPQTLTFEKDGSKLPATPAPAPVPAPGAAPQLPGLPVNRPPLPQPPGATPTPNFQLPMRIPRVPGVVTAGAPQSSPLPNTPSYLPGNTASPIGGPQNTISLPTSASGISPEEQAIMIEANRQAGGTAAALLPPTILTPKLNEQTPSTPQPVNQTPTLPPMPGRPFVPGPY